MQALFYRSGRIVDIFLPGFRPSGNLRGFVFVRFPTYREAELAIQMAEGRSWGGRRIKVNLARSQASNSDGTLAAAKVPPPGVPAGVKGVNAWAMKSRLALKEPAGWIVEVGEGRGVRLASWVVAAEK